MASSTSNLDVNEHHEEILREYIRYFREQTSIGLRSFHSIGDEFKIRRLSDESMMTVNEIEDLLNEFAELFRKEFEQEFTHQYRVNALLIKQLFQQAEQWFLRLNPNFDQLENRRLIDLIRDYEQHQLPNKKSQRTRDLYDPINDTKSTILLKTEIEKLQQLNSQLKSRLLQYEKDDDLLTHEFEEKSRLHSNKEASFHQTLTTNEKRLKDIQQALALAENELEKKFNQTNTFMNMKKIIEQKNQQIRELRQQLAGADD